MMPSLYRTNRCRLGPLIVLGDLLFSKTRGSQGVASLISPSGAAHRLRLLGSVQMLFDHHRIVSREALKHRASQHISTKWAQESSDPVVYFVRYLVPTFHSRDWAIDAIQLPAEVDQDDPVFALDTALRDAPMPLVPSPSLWLEDRIWRLRVSDGEPTGTHIVIGDIALTPQRPFLRVSSLYNEWLNRFDTAIENRIRQDHSSQNIDVPSARRNLAENGHLRFGDLLLVGGNPPMIGHILPDHFNHTFFCQVRRDVAFVAPFTLPPKRGPLSVYRLDDRRGWRPADLNRGLCLGPQPPDGLSESPGLALLAYLRWAAIRVAFGNERFHEHDGQERE